ncbi:NACHT domain-containing protein [Scytonema sp. UIC 10036]|uniref:NACHT domain-containing protein n=1 Tax=Scytonema sp. UIC 10036 TaxID=2304196 RepID=UPI0012DA98A6|nr:NACHT domain-containing protein [Scytonema sp. UIC 10036]MUG91745.1 NACHT domain-containing protein [Scytonema sp. UIC 10036]
MPKLFKDYLLPLLLVFSNGLLAWLINQLPSKQDLKIENPVILLLTGTCIVACFILTLLSAQPQNNASQTNYNWVESLLPLLGGFILYGLLKNKLLSQELSTIVSYIALFLVILGTVIPPIIVLPKKYKKKLIWVPACLSLLITVIFLIRRELLASVLWLFLTLTLTIFAFFGSFVYNITHKVFQKLYKEMKASEQSLANYISRKMLINTSTFKQEYYQNLIYICRDFQTQGLDKDRILKLHKVFVPLKIAAKETANIRSAIILEEQIKTSNSSHKEIWNFLAAKGKDNKLVYPRMAVLGVPGSGKTTLLRHLTLCLATNEQRKLDPKIPKLIPVLLYLRDVRQEIVKNQPPLADLITQQVKQQRKIQPLNPPDNWFSEKLGENKCLVMLDGLDEVADETERRLVSTWVDEQMRAYPDTPFILTSRPFGYKTAQLQQEVIVLEVQPFSLKQMEDFIHNWYCETEIMARAGEKDLGVREEAKKNADDLIKRIKDSNSLVSMALNPLLLTMIATVHRRGSALPGKRVELYKEICQVLLERRQRSKNMPDTLTASQKQAVLQVLALGLMQQKTREFKLSEGIERIKHKLAEVAGRGVNPEDFIKKICDFSALLVEKELNIYEFAHLSFQEYLAASQIKELNIEPLLIRNINNSWWSETIRLYSAQTNASNLISQILEMPDSSVEAIALAYDCVKEGLSVDPDVRRKLEDKIEAGLVSDISEIFNLAARVKLSLRLKKLLRINDGVEIDSSLITCAEYQIPIAERWVKIIDYGENEGILECQVLPPSDWLRLGLPQRDVRKKIIITQANNAQAFCEWLNDKYSLSGFKYRLPTQSEIQNYPTKEPLDNYWYQDSAHNRIVSLIETEVLAGIRIVRENLKDKNNIEE